MDYLISVLVLIPLTGFFWCAVGIFYSRAAERKDTFYSFMLLSSICSILFVLGMDFPSLRAPLSETGTVCGIMAAAGIAGILGFLALRNAMHYGHHGVAWCTAQAAMVCPFLAGSLIFHDKTTLVQYAGMTLLGLSLIPLALAKQERGGKETGKTNKTRFCFWSFSAFFLLGTQQTLSMLPLRVPGIGAEALSWRVPMILLCGILWMIPVWKTGGIQFRGCWKNALSYGIAVACGQVCLYLAIDKMHHSGAIGAVYPLACGICILLFFFYCRLFRKERNGVRGFAGITILTLGILLFVLPEIIK